jgi:multidrug efflux system membrane fusion protein
LRALVDNPKGLLWPGRFVYVFPVVEMIEKAVLVPLSAVAQGQDGPYAFVVEDGKVTVRSVEKGPVVGNALVVNQGIQAGDVVVTSGQLALWSGASVQILTTPDAATQADIQKRMNDPNSLALAQALVSKGEGVGQIAMILGIPEDRIPALLSGREPETLPPPATP